MSRKRGNAEGSIYQDATGRWRAAVHVGYVNGQRKRKVFSGRTREEVARKLAKALHDHQTGLPLDPDRQTVGQFLDHWLEKIAAESVRPKTLRTYRDLVRLHLSPGLGKVPLGKLRPQHVRDFLAGKGGTGGLSPRTLKHLRATLRAALNVAVKDGVLSRNAAALVEAPREESPYEPVVFSPEQARLFLEEVRGHRLEALFTVALALGLRQGEALGLRWEDVDLECGSLRVRYQLQRLAAGLVLTEPKTKRSRRALLLPAVVKSALALHRQRQDRERALASDRWKDTGLVFTTTIGTPVEQRNLLREFYEIFRRHHARVDEAARRGEQVEKLPRIRFHDLRHSAATLLLAQGVHPRVVMELLGHSTITLTMNTYSHVIPAMQRDAANQMDGILGQRPVSTPVATSVATTAVRPS